jgi:hypothetical protein
MLKGNRRLARLVTLALMVPLAVVLLASTAFAEGKPKAPYNHFTLCPLKNAKVKQCIYSDTTSGKVTLGKQEVPITNPLTLQGGIYLNEEGEDVFVNPEGAPVLSNSPQNVPGGLLGLLPPEFLPEPLKFFFEEYIINKGPTGVTATTEVVGEVKINEGALINGANEPALTLPVRVHLNNSFLGSECYVGSSAHPITLALTTGTTSPPGPNKPITGTIGTITITEENQLLKITGNSLVGNAFSAPKAEKCVNYVPWWLGGELIEALALEVLDNKIGLPSAAGNNTAILNNTIEKASAKTVKAAE